MSDMFFIIASICIVIITIVLCILLLKLIRTADEVDDIVLKTQEATSKATQALGTMASVGAILSPALGISKLLFGRKKRK